MRADSRRHLAPEETETEMGTPSEARLLELACRQHVFRASDAVAAGVHRDELRRFVAEGTVARLGRNLYARPRAERTAQESLATVAACVPQGFFCVLTALRLHGLRVDRPAEIWLALDRRVTVPRIDFVPVRIVRMSGAALAAGIQGIEVDGTSTRITSPARTVVDCFRFRNTIGPKTAIDALKALRSLGKDADDEMWAHVEALRMWNVMSPFRNWPS